MFKKATVVMLPTNQEAMIWQHYNTKRLSLSDINTKYHLTDNLYGIHLYIVSDEEIKEGDWMYSPTLEAIEQCVYIPKNKEYWFKGIFKIIATTDTSIKQELSGLGETAMCPLPQLSQQFIEDYIKEYNKGNIITDILVEMVRCVEPHIATMTSKEYFIPKVTFKDNTIIIKKVKDSLTREDLTILNQIIPLDSDFTNAKIGDKVTYLNHSFGEIVDINKNSKYPIACQMGGSTFTFTLDGKFSTQDIIPALVKGHHAEIILCTKP